MRFGSGYSADESTAVALAEALTAATGRLEADPDILFAFASQFHREQADHIASVLAALVSEGGTSLGCVAEGVIGNDKEADDGPGLSVWAAVLPGVDWVGRHLEAVRVPGRGVVVSSPPSHEGAVGLIMLADPFSFPTVPFVSKLGEAGLPVVGGLADAGAGPRGAALWLDGEVHDHGAVVLSLAGEVEFAPVVSQGCRPLGQPAVVTRAEDRELHAIAGVPATEYLMDLFNSLEPDDRELARRGLHLGVVVDEYRPGFAEGDFLIRAVVGLDHEKGSVSVGEKVAVGRTVQFQVRDPATADAELRHVLRDRTADGGILLFSCNGRGRRFFGEPDHDAALVTELTHPPALAGFFAAGEIGPIGGGNYLHGFTASMVEVRSTAP